MKYNKFILQHIMENKFINSIEIKVSHDLVRLNEYDLYNIFFNKVETVRLSCIAGISIERFDTVNNGGGTVVSGEMTVSAEVNGFIKQNNEWVIAEGGMLNFEYSFWFIEENGNLRDLELEYSC